MDLRSYYWRRHQCRLCNLSLKQTVGRYCTLEICTLRFLCTPEHSIHSRIPKFKDAQSGSWAPQSAHSVLPGTLCNTSSGLSCCSWLLYFAPRRGMRSRREPLLEDSVSSMPSHSDDAALNVLVSLPVRWWRPLGLRNDRWHNEFNRSGHINSCTSRYQCKLLLKQMNALHCNASLPALALDCSKGKQSLQ